MNIVSIIEKKKNGGVLSGAEISYFVDGSVRGSIAHYQISALFMAICWQGMNERETYDLTMAMVNSGEVLDLSLLPGTTIDKHSTGGVGDKLTLITAPIWAATGFSVAKMSGSALGHTGGTIDKLASIPHLNLQLTYDEFLALAQDNPLVISAQSANLVPADKIFYALRDVTATVNSLPLIAASIMSKKLAISCDILVLDVKYGASAFMKTYDEALSLARLMAAIGNEAGRKVGVVLSPMNRPLGYAVGNALEVLEALEVLKGGGNENLRRNALILAAVGYLMAAVVPTLEAGVIKAEKALHDASATKAFQQFLTCQGSFMTVNAAAEELALSSENFSVVAESEGIVSDIRALPIALVAMDLGAGRRQIGDVIDYGAGVLLHKQVGDTVRRGETLATLYSSKSRDYIRQGAAQVLAAISITTKEVNLLSEKHSFIYDGEVYDLTGFFAK